MSVISIIKGNKINTERDSINVSNAALLSNLLGLGETKTSADTEGVITQSFGSGKSLSYIYQGFIVADRG